MHESFAQQLQLEILLGGETLSIIKESYLVEQQMVKNIEHTIKPSQMLHSAVGHCCFIPNVTMAVRPTTPIHQYFISLSRILAASPAARSSCSWWWAAICWSTHRR